MESNKLTLNIDKCEYIIFNPMSHKSDCEMSKNIHIEGTNLKKVEHTKILGIKFDNNVKFDEHIATVVNKLKKFIPIFYRLRDILPLDVLRMMHEQLCLPLIKHCLIVYGSGNKNSNRCLQRIHKTLIKIIHRKEKQSLELHFYKREQYMNIASMYQY